MTRVNRRLGVLVGLLPLALLLIAGAAPAFSSTQAPLSGSRPLDISALPKNPVAYERQKAIANARYATWAEKHGVRAATRYTSVSGSLNKPGLDASTNPDTPPDTTGSIGPSNYVEMVNDELGVYSSSSLTTPTATVSEQSFVGDTFPCDGQIQWDEQGQRWLYSMLGGCDGSHTGSERLYVGFSKGTSPAPLNSSNWCQYQIPTGSNLEDYDKLGHDNTQIIIGANEFDDLTGDFNEGKVFVLPKPAAGTITTCPTQTAEVTNSLVTLAAPDAFTPVPANIQDSSTDGYVVATDNVNSGNTDNVRLDPSSTALHVYTIVPGVQSGNISPPTDVTVPSYSEPANVPQAGTTDTVDSLDGRLTQAVAVTDPNTGQEGIWTQHTVAGSGGGPSVVRWYELTPGHTTPTQVGTVTGPNNSFAFMGAISPAEDGNNAAIFYNTSSSTSLPDFRVEDRHADTPSGTMIEDLQLATSAYEDSDFSCPSQDSQSSVCRWGDYNGASPDPSNANLVWGTGELTTIAPDGVGDPQWGSQNVAIDVSEPSTYTLDVVPNGSGTGTVASTDDHISCPSVCSYAYAHGSLVHLTESPGDSNSTFEGWTGGGCSGTGTHCDVTMDQAQSVTATFSLVQESLTLTKLGAGSGTIGSNLNGINCGSTCSTFDYGTSVVLTATPATGSVFTGWSGEGCLGTGTCTVLMTQARSVTAFFALAPETLTVSKSGAGSGAVTSDVSGISCGSTCSHDYDYGTSVQLTATPATGSVFTGWSGACSGTSTCAVPMTSATAVIATFGLAPETLTVTKSGSGSGRVTSSVAGISCGSACSHAFGYGTSVTLTATPSPGSTFAGWSGACSGTVGCTVPLTAATSVTAKFTKIVCVVPKLKGKTLSAAKRAITAANCSVGTVKKKTSQTVKKGKVISQSPAPDKQLKDGAPVALVVSKGK